MQKLTAIKKLALDLLNHPLWSKLIFGEVIALAAFIEFLRRWDKTDSNYPTFKSFLGRTYWWFIVLGITAAIYIVKIIAHRKRNKKKNEQYN